jgi:hypothetical protein
MTNYYGGLIFTNHALQRLSERQFPQHMVLDTFNRPDKSFPGKQPGSYEYQRRFGASTVTVIAKQNERREWLVLSCWIDPPLPGTKDHKQRQHYLAYRNAGFWKRLWLTFKAQIGL